MLEHLPQANFDPEFFERYEQEVQLYYQQEMPGKVLAIKAKKGLFSHLFK